MTFFPWRGIQPGRIGAGQSTSTAFSVPAGSLGWWSTTSPRWITDCP